ncbi:MAG TPA: hypothetical protein VFR45_09355 [Nocardioides sp.]|nr:hypothetical protein [Nocardioides sp.]
MESIEVVVGRIGKPHGIRGEVTVDVRTDEPAAEAPAEVPASETPEGAADANADLENVTAEDAGKNTSGVDADKQA